MEDTREMIIQDRILSNTMVPDEILSFDDIFDIVLSEELILDHLNNYTMDQEPADARLKKRLLELNRRLKVFFLYRLEESLK